MQALFCHVRFAADTARFSTAFARRGLVAEYGIAATLPRLVGLENALDLLISARTFDAAEAKALGVVSRVVPRDEVLTAAKDYARDIAGNCAPAAVAVIAAQVLDGVDGTSPTHSTVPTSKPTSASAPPTCARASRRS